MYLAIYRRLTKVVQMTVIFGYSKSLHYYRHQNIRLHFIKFHDRQIKNHSFIQTRILSFTLFPAILGSLLEKYIRSMLNVENAQLNHTT